jgi:ElaB/YqjD/DUF883 family membrane-anchored ribosome-binding protein
MATPHQDGFNAADRNTSALAAKHDSDQDRAALEELSETIAELSRVAHARINRTARIVNESAANNPWATVAIAGLAGLALAVVLPKRETSKAHKLTSLAGYEIPPAYQIPLPNVHRPSLEPLTARLERLVDSISKIDPSTVSAPALQAARDWLTNVFAAVKARPVSGS